MLRDPAFFWRPNNTASRGRGEGRIGRLRSLEEMPPKYALFSTVLSKIVAFSLVSCPCCFCLQVVQHLKHRTSQVTCSLRRSSLQQQQTHSCTRIDVSPVYMTPAPRREGPENNEDRDNWGEHWGELVLEHGQPGTEWVNEPEISAKIIKKFPDFL